MGSKLRMFWRWALHGFKPTLFLKARCTDMASTASATRLALEMLAAAHDGAAIEVDMSVVESVTGGWALNCFGAVAFVKGEAWVVKYVTVIGARESVLRNIAEAIRQGASMEGAYG